MKLCNNTEKNSTVRTVALVSLIAAASLTPISAPHADSLASLLLARPARAEYVYNKKLETAYFAGGCFWGMEETFRQMKGVEKTTVGFSGGSAKEPSYEQVCTGKTGHAETVKVEFDPKVVSYKALVDTFFRQIDPTTMNAQGPDHGEQYRSAIFYSNDSQKAEAMEGIKTAQHLYSRKIVTQVMPESTFYAAEEYHQQYLEKHGMAVCH